MPFVFARACGVLLFVSGSVCAVVVVVGLRPGQPGCAHSTTWLGHPLARARRSQVAGTNSIACLLLRYLFRRLHWLLASACAHSCCPCLPALPVGARAPHARQAAGLAVARVGSRQARPAVPGMIAGVVLVVLISCGLDV